MTESAHTTATIVENESPDDTIILIGGLSSNPTWEEYIAGYTDEFRPKLEAIRRAIEQSGWLKRTGQQFCNDHYFRLNDGTSVAFTWRAWGDLMQAIVGEREGYMAYYM